jgi:hypothetical protein
MTQLEICSQELLRFTVNFGFRIFGNGWRIEKVEETVVLHSLRHCANRSLGLVLLLLLDCLHGDVLSGFPVDCAAFASDDLGAFEAERFFSVRSTLHLVFLCQLCVGEKVVGCENEVQSESLKKNERSLSFK